MKKTLGSLVFFILLILMYFVVTNTGELIPLISSLLVDINVGSLSSAILMIVVGAGFWLFSRDVGYKPERIKRWERLGKLKKEPIVSQIKKQKLKITLSCVSIATIWGGILTLPRIASPSIAWHTLSILLLFAFLVVINYLSFLYRVKAGYYGNNIREAREIIRFIQANSDGINNRPGSGGRRIQEKATKKEESETLKSSDGLQHA